MSMILRKSIVKFVTWVFCSKLYSVPKILQNLYDKIISVIKYISCILLMKLIRASTHLFFNSPH